MSLRIFFLLEFLFFGLCVAGLFAIGILPVG